MHSYRGRRIGRFGRVGKVYGFASMRARHVRAYPSDPSAFPLSRGHPPANCAAITPTPGAVETLAADPFAGSGSSRVAAEKLGLDLAWRGCDIDPQFAETTLSATA